MALSSAENSHRMRRLGVGMSSQPAAGADHRIVLSSREKIARWKDCRVPWLRVRGCCSCRDPEPPRTPSVPSVPGYTSRAAHVTLDLHLPVQQVCTIVINGASNNGVDGTQRMRGKVKRSQRARAKPKLVSTAASTVTAFPSMIMFPAYFFRNHSRNGDGAKSISSLQALFGKRSQPRYSIGAFLTSNTITFDISSRYRDNVRTYRR